MRLAIVFSTKYGSTQFAAEAIARGCEDGGLAPGDIRLQNLQSSSELPEADTIVIGAPVYGGSIPRRVSRFMESNLEALLNRRVGLYLSCLYEGDRAERQLADNFPARLVAHSFGQYYPGGQVEVGRLRWLDRLIMKRVAGIEEDVDRTRPEEVRRLIDDLMQP